LLAPGVGLADVPSVAGDGVPTVALEPHPAIAANSKRAAMEPSCGMRTRYAYEQDGRFL
jgi:hypothetical protein